NEQTPNFKNYGMKQTTRLSGMPDWMTWKPGCVSRVTEGLMKQLRIALVGDYRPEVRAHRAIPLALARAAAETGIPVQPVWIATPRLLPDAAAALAGCA